MPQPNYTQQLNEIWGWPQEVGGEAFPLISIASNVIVGDNPPYSITNFLQAYPQFGGTAKLISGSLISGSVNLTAVMPDLTGIFSGQYLTDANGATLAAGTSVLSATGTTIVLSQAAIANGLPGQWKIYVAMPVPAAVVNAYIYLAVNSLYEARWGTTMWPLAIGLFVAHYLTLWAQSQTPAGASVQQIAAAGLALGIDIGQHAGDVSYSSKPMEIEGFGAFNLTLFGQELATLAQVIGSATMLLW